MREGEAWKARFFTVWTGQQLSLIGSRIAQFALVWWVTEKTGSATVLATATMVALLPRILLGPIIGSLVDRWNRQRIMMISDAFIALVSLWLAYLFWTGTMQVWHVYVVMLARSAGGAFQGPAAGASTALMVPDAHYTRVGGLNQTIAGVLSIAAPPLGALFLALLPLSGVMMIDVGTALFAIVPLFFLRIPQPPPEHVNGIRAASVLANTRDGLRFILRWPGLLALVGLVLVMKIVMMPAFSLAPVLILKEFGRSASGLAMYQALVGAGTIGGGLLIGVWGGFKRRILTILLGLGGMGLGSGIVGFASTERFWMALVGAGVIGGMMAIANAPYAAILQARIPSHIQGRVMASLGSLLTLTTPLGLAMAGPISDLLGVQFWYRIGGVICILAAAAGLLFPAVMRLEDQESA